MKPDNLIAKAETTLNAPAEIVWKALITPDTIKKYMFGTTVTSDWKKGSAITWKGEWQGKSYEDKGEILDLIPNKKLRYSHFSPLAGLEDKPENYHTVDITLEPEGKQTKIILTQDNNPTEEERQHSQQNWEMMLKGLKKQCESQEQRAM